MYDILRIFLALGRNNLNIAPTPTSPTYIGIDNILRIDLSMY